jgi:hypothetical protein
VAPPARPLTPSEVAAVRARRSELSSQLTSAAGRRDEIAAQLERASPASRPGLQDRLDVLDLRIVQLEKDIAETGRLLTSPQYTSTTEAASKNFMGLSPGQTTGVSIVFTIFVLFPLAISLARLLWRKGTTHGPPIPDAAEAARRLAGLEQAVDAIAVEIERVSEGQRFVTKIFAESQGMPALNPGQRPAEPIRVGQEDKAGTSRER